MKDIVYSKDLVESMPTGTFVQEQIQTLRDSLEHADAEREEMWLLLNEIAEAGVEDDLEEILCKVKEYIEQKGYPETY